MISDFTSREVQQRLGVPADRISICRPGAPDWTARAAAPADGYVLFVGTLEPRKNVGALLDAYEALLSRGVRRLPPLVLAGQPTPDAAAWLARIARPPLLGHVRLLGYVEPSARRSLYEGALMLVQPSHEEGFGMPVLEAMTARRAGGRSRAEAPCPRSSATRVCLPISTGRLTMRESLAGSMRQMIGDEGLRASASARGVARARSFQWAAAAEAAAEAYDRALHRRRLRT